MVLALKTARRTPAKINKSGNPRSNRQGGEERVELLKVEIDPVVAGAGDSLTDAFGHVHRYEHLIKAVRPAEGPLRPVPAQGKLPRGHAGGSSLAALRDHRPAIGMAVHIGVEVPAKVHRPALARRRYRQAAPRTIRKARQGRSRSYRILL